MGERWTIRPGRVVEHDDGTAHYAPTRIVPEPELDADPFEVMRSGDGLRGAVEEVQAIMAAADARRLPFAGPCLSHEEWERMKTALARALGC